MNHTKELIRQASRALESEIETVREKPSTDTLFNGQRVDGLASGATDYQFTSYQPSIRFAEEIVATTGGKSVTVHPLSFKENVVVLRFPENVGERIDQVDLEWENDFILKRTLSEIEKLEDADKEIIERVECLFNPASETIRREVPLYSDGNRNESQADAIRKAMECRTLFIWGPPGTGKTDTLGYIIANYLKHGKRVLFASNTNRAVDVGLLSALNALEVTNSAVRESSVCRFGDAALDNHRLEPYLFETQIERVTERRKQQAGEWIDLLRRREDALRSVEKRLQKGKKPTSNQELELKLIEQKIEDAGGLEVLEERMDSLLRVSERSELWKKNLIATTLAKVCTSELFHDLDFDAVVIDEGSMASLPYLMVLASHAKSHMVVVGDPMQLPPIALTSDEESRTFLEKDIFTTVSGAEASEALFAWHDENPEFTSFFDTQYRLEASLAEMISSVFYDGRLKSGKLPGPEGEMLNDRAFHLVDSSRYGPFLEQKRGERGFKPVNSVHQDIVERLLKNMGNRGIFMERIGIIVPFRSVVYDLRNRLYHAGIRNVEVGTIHTFQGREKDYIIFDTVMSGEQQRGQVRHYSVRPLDEQKNGLSVPRLLNVALSRSKKELVVIADMGHINKVYGKKFLGRLLNRMVPKE